MKTSSILLLVATLLVNTLNTGCARPRYESAQNPSGPPSIPQKVSDCQVRFHESKACLLWSWEKTPTTTEMGVLSFKIVRANLLDDSPLPVDFAGDWSVILWMPSMGHGSTPTRVERLDVGSFRVSSVFFIMPGDWEIRFQLKEGGQVRDEAIVSLMF